MQELNRECGIDLRQERSIKREEANEGSGHHEEDSDEDTTGDHDSSDSDSSDRSRDYDGDGRVIPPGLVRRTFQTRGAFKYGKSPSSACFYCLELRLLYLQWSFS